MHTAAVSVVNKAAEKASSVVTSVSSSAHQTVSSYSGWMSKKFAGILVLQLKFLNGNYCVYICIAGAEKVSSIRKSFIFTPSNTSTEESNSVDNTSTTVTGGSEVPVTDQEFTHDEPSSEAVVVEGANANANTNESVGGNEQGKDEEESDEETA